MCEIHILRINRSINIKELSRFFCLISEDKQKRILNFKNDYDIQRSLLGEILARYALCQKLNIKNKSLKLENTIEGKPILINSQKNSFNISHSGEWVVCALCDSGKVGVDIEEIKPIDYKIAQRFFAKKEYERLLKTYKGHQLQYFFSIWTLKESYIKAEGRGLSIPLNSFHFSFIEDKIVMYLGNKEMNQYNFSQPHINKNVTLSVCSESKCGYKLIYYNVDTFTEKGLSVLY